MISYKYIKRDYLYISIFFIYGLFYTVKDVHTNEAEKADIFYEVDDYADIDKNAIFGDTFKESKADFLSEKQNIVVIDVLINNYFNHSAKAIFQNGIQSVEAQKLRDTLSGILEDTFFDSLDDESQYITIDSLENIGLIVEFDESRMDLNITIPFHYKKLQHINVRRSSGLFSEYEKEALNTSKFSAFINWFSEAKKIESQGIKSEKTKKIYFNNLFKYGMNFKDGIIVGDIRLDQDNSSKSLIKRGPTQILFPNKQKLTILKIGDIRYQTPNFLEYQGMIGINYSRFFHADPYFETQFLGANLLELRSKSDVEIYVNHNKVKTLNLDSGIYDLHSFPLVDGFSDIEFVITDASGYQTKIKYDIISYASNLAKGLHDFSYSAGLKSEQEKHQIRYSSDLFASFFHKYGFTNRLTIGYNGQFSRDEKLLGLTTIYGNILGKFEYDIALLKQPNRNKISNAHSLQYIHLPNNFLDSYVAVKFEKRDRAFRSRDISFSGLDENKIAEIKQLNIESSVSLNKIIFHNYNMNLRYYTRNYYDDAPTESFIRLLINKVFPKLSFNAGLGYNLLENDIHFNISFNVPLGNHKHFSSSYNTHNSEFYSEISKKPRERALNYGYSFGYNRNKESDSMDFDLNYSTYRNDFKIFGKLMQNYNDLYDNHINKDSEIGFGFATALVAADGVIALSRPIHNNFAILSIKNNDMLKDIKGIGINPIRRNDQINYEAEINKFGHAVITDLPDYRLHHINIDHYGLPRHHSIPKDKFLLYSKYYSGFHIEIENQMNNIIKFKLYGDNGQAIILGEGIFYKKGDRGNFRRFLSDRAGNVMIHNLQANTEYIFEVSGEINYKAEIIIPQQEQYMVHIGDIIARAD